MEYCSYFDFLFALCHPEVGCSSDNPDRDIKGYIFEAWSRADYSFARLDHCDVNLTLLTSAFPDRPPWFSACPL